MAKTFRVVIVGASVTGLATALALESAGIDFVVLEGGVIAPPVGASIALMGPAFRILDQLGCYDEILAASNRPTQVMRLRDEKGVPFLTSLGNMEHLASRHGYPMIFMKRQSLQRILYSHVKNKDKVLTGKRVDEVITATNGVMVKTKDGETFTGNILIGADGVHSLVRREMWRLAAESRPGWFPQDELQRVETKGMITFGITEPKIIQPFIDFTTHQGHTYLSAMGSDGVVFWFLFSEVEKRDGTNIARYTDKDVLENVRKYGNEQVANGWTLLELHENSTITGAAPVIDHIFTKWHYKRILTIGDSAHVQNPISGYGGQSCLESVAAFINALKPALEMDASTGAGGLTDADFDSIFAGIQKSRMKRIQTLLKGSRAMADILSLKGIARYLLPAIVQVTGQQGQLMRFANSWASATRLDHLPIPKRSRMVPYNDELPADRIKSSLPKLITITALMASFYLSWAGTALPEGVPFSSWAGAHPTLSNYTGTGLDGTLGIMSSFFSYMLVPEDPIPRFQAVELLTIFVSLQAIWMVEANRKANALSLIRLPSIIAIAAQFFTFGRAGHLYWISAIYTSTNSVVQRHVPVPASRAVLPAICLGYILPTALMFIPFQDDALRDRLTAFWQPTPVWCSLLVVLFTSLVGRWEQRRLTGKTEFDVAVERAKAWYTKREVSALKSTYSFVFATSALVHITVVLYAWLEGGLPTLWRLFGDVPNPLVGTTGMTNPAETVVAILKYDLIFTVLPMLLFLLYTVWDIRSLGYITTPTARKVAAGVLMGQILVGPAATYAGLWYFRECVFEDLSS